MLRIGLTGGMGAGKSTVSKILESRGAVIVDSDKIAREVVEPGTEGLTALVAAFGDDILATDGNLDRAALAAKAFVSDEARGKLNSIVHPLVGKRTAELIAAAPADAVLVQDIPLLVENGLGPLFSLVIVVFVDAEERVHRLVEHRGVPEKDARARISAQATDEQRRAAADVWLDNSGPPGTIDAQVHALWDERLVPFERNIRNGQSATSVVKLVPADPEWPAQAQRLIGRLHVACGASAMRIDHIGSTAVAGLAAKDVIDLQITVADLATADKLAEPLEKAGFPRNSRITADNPKPTYGVGGEADPGIWQKRLHGNADPKRPASLHIRVANWPGQQFALAFRDWLRENADIRDEYSAIKRHAEAKASAFTERSDAIDAYLSVKEPWFDTAYHRAMEWAASQEGRR
ncbi:dephospho-CoA kinase [Antrihabitans sp. YC3-6]|uniref:Dephospho-CoA kinase n=1 Tax=Antrihabitans stalagmiti TaxID=2799499 RepID=A0A934NUU8_9NOCA|nr:dephospho-CoA kinase [Antrihabitans stalagmiti]MBJ8341585.1 dephospho-CoA kinase [Antrihabitans stalagmiti]